MIKKELNIVGENITKNLSSLDLEPDYNDAASYFLTELCQSNLEAALNKPLKEEVKSLPTEPGNSYYTHGNEFIISEGDYDTDLYDENYVGYYHIHEGINGIEYMVGEYHTTEDHPILKPVAGELVIPIGDLIDYEGMEDYSTTPSESQPFILEKYISINGTKHSTSEAMEIIKSNPSTSNISDIYPGTLEIMYRSSLLDVVSAKTSEGLEGALPSEMWDEAIGLSGELGVRYGIQLSLLIDESSALGDVGTKSEAVKIELLSVEMDVLDKTIGEIIPFEGDSYQLLCMINKLKKDPKFKLITDYVFPVKKHISLMAIYNNLAFVPSIGQITINPFIEIAPSDTFVMPEGDNTPGVSVAVDNNYEVTYSTNDAWSSLLYRVLNTPAVRAAKFDNWEVEILGRTRDVIKESLERAYNSADEDFSTMLNNAFAPGRKLGRRNNRSSRRSSDANMNRRGLSVSAIAALKNKLKPDAATAASDILSRTQRKQTINNPFDAEGSLCKKG